MLRKVRILFFILTDPKVLNHWLDVVKPGGIICFSVKNSLWEEWEPQQQKHVEEGRWLEVWIHPGIPYLPSLKSDGTNACRDVVKIYIYRKVK